MLLIFHTIIKLVARNIAEKISKINIFVSIVMGRSFRVVIRIILRTIKKNILFRWIRRLILE